MVQIRNGSIPFAAEAKKDGKSPNKVLEVQEQSKDRKRRKTKNGSHSWGSEAHIQLRQKMYDKQENDRLIAGVMMMVVNCPAKKKGIVAVLMSAIRLPVIKGKLGYDVNTEDGEFLTKIKANYLGVNGNASGFFGPPVWSGLVLMNTRIGAYETALNTGTDSAKSTAKGKAMRSANLFMAYVNGVAADDQDNAISIFGAAKCEVINRGKHEKQDISADYGASTGEVILRSLAGKNPAGKLVRTTYYWQWSITVGDAKVWKDFDSTSVADMVATGMEVNVEHYFRKRTIIRVNRKNVSSVWSDFVTLTPR